MMNLIDRTFTKFYCNFIAEISTRAELSEITYLTSKLEISDQPKYVAVRQYYFISLARKSNRQNLIENKQLAAYLQQPFLLSSDYNCAFREKGSEILETQDMSWLPSVTK